LTAVSTAYATPPFLPFFHPPIELARWRPRSRLHPDRRTDVDVGLATREPVFSVPSAKGSHANFEYRRDVAISEWAPAIGVMCGAAIGALSAVGIQARLWRHERGTRWDPDTLAAYARFLEYASETFDQALILASSKNEPNKTEVQAAFDTMNQKTALAYEELVLLDLTARPQARRLTWILWNTGKEPIASLNPDDATRNYRDARFHLRDNAQTRLKIPKGDVGKAPPSEECDPETHDDPVGRPRQDSPWARQ
jgi:hypothetical protein